VIVAKIKYPGVYIEETPSGSRSIHGVATSHAAFVDCFDRGPIDTPVLIRSFNEFDKTFGGLDPLSEASYGVQLFFLNGGEKAWVVRVTSQGSNGIEPMSMAWWSKAAKTLVGSASEKTGMFALTKIPSHEISILCIPAAVNCCDEGKEVYCEAIKLCQAMRAFLLVDIPEMRNEVSVILKWSVLGSLRSNNAALYFPLLTATDHQAPGESKRIGCSGAVAGIFARTDALRGVWNAPAGTEATIRGANLTLHLSDEESGRLTENGINALRSFPIRGDVVWGARTLAGGADSNSDWKYIPARRLALFIEESLFYGLGWVVFEPNDESMWAQIRLSVGAFMHELFRQGALKGQKPEDGYFVKCDSETTTRSDRNCGVVNVEVGFAPLKPAEFIVLRMQQKTKEAAAVQ
jgi:phage tail sheath protein FI